MEEEGESSKCDDKEEQTQPQQLKKNYPPVLPTTSASVDDTSPISDSTSSCYCVSFSDVKAAARRIEGKVHRTPVMTCQFLTRATERRALYFKVEALQKTGSFKFRGAVNAISAAMTMKDNLSQSNPTTKKLTTVVTHSSGNHAQAVARAASVISSDLEAFIVMPRNTPLVKKSAVQDFGGTIVLVDNTNEAREEEASRIVADLGESTCLFVHPSEDPSVIAGQGTVCLEFLQQVQQQYGEEGALDVVIIPVGGGGLAAGNTISVRGLLGSSVKIVLAEPTALDDAARSFYSKKLLGHDPGNLLESVADGLKTTLGLNTWPIVRDLVDDILTVSERDILVATKLIWEKLKITIEPSAGVGVAVALSNDFRRQYPPSQYPRVGIVLCGGNVDVLKIAAKMIELNV